jgi:hypothetical protein
MIIFMKIFKIEFNNPDNVTNKYLSNFFSHFLFSHHRHRINTMLGGRKLEVRSIGNRSFIFMDICHCLCGRYLPNYTPSANAVRHNQPDRYSIFEDCQEEARTTENGE